MTNDTAKKPHLIAYHVREGEQNGKSYWTRIGAAWRHEDGKGANVVLELMPIAQDGKARIVLRVPEEKHGQSAV